MRPVVDSHCHLDMLGDATALAGVLSRARLAGVEALVTIGTGRTATEIGRALDIARAHTDWIRATAGIHPHDARFADDALVARVTELARDPLCVAVGEIGLDYHYDSSPREAQRELFRRLVAVARDVRKPIVVHTRSAPDDTLAVLREEGAREVGGIIHCFSEGPDFARAAVDLGFACSFSGIVTFPSARGVHEAARVLPLEALLVETDAPYLAPVPYRGKKNEPAFVVHTAARLATIRGLSEDAIREATTRNARRWLGLDVPAAAG